MVYNWRIDRENRDRVLEILGRLQTEHTLSQGWGGGDEQNLNVGQDDFVAKCKICYGLASTRIPTNLTRIRDLKQGDLLVVPHLPENGRASIHVVASDYPTCYDYKIDDKTHQNHRIRIQRSYGLGGEISIHNVGLSAWYGKLQWMRLPIFPIPQYQADFQQILVELGIPGHRLDASNIDSYIEKLRTGVLGQLKKELEKINAARSDISFEAVCEQLLLSAGYLIARRNQYNNAGGDIDLRCERARSDASPFETGQTLLFVQVKKHIGTTDEWSVQQLLQMIENEPEADGCVMSLADNFSPEAKELAAKHGIALLNGDDVCSLVLKKLSGTTGD